MSNVAYDLRQVENMGSDVRPTAEADTQRALGRIPSISIHAFCETSSTAEVMESAVSDRRMSRAELFIRQGGIPAAIRFYQDTLTPNLIIVESCGSDDALLGHLDALALVCDAATKVVVIGASNDIALYRALLARGISEYLHAPVDPLTVISTVANVFSGPEARKLGRVYAFIGAKGGVGSSSVAHNTAWMLGQHFGTDAILADMDLPFGSASLNFDLEPVGGLAEAVRDVDRLDEQMLERLLVPCSDHVKLLAAPTLLETSYDFEAGAFDAVIELAQANVSHVVLDIPHLWSAWSRKTLIAADEVVITAAPDLANLKNVKNLVAVLKQARPHDPAPRLVLNQVGMPKRPEIKPAAFTEAIGLEPVISLPFDAKTFGIAANSGRVIADAASRTKAAKAFRQLAENLSGRGLPSRKRLGGLGWLLGRKKTLQRA